MTTFLDELRRETNLTLTENGAVTNRSALDPVVDFFARAGAMRGNPEGAADLFEAAFNAEPLAAVRVMFYLRDVRGGQGERAVFKACLRRLWQISPGKFARYVEHVPFYGRWDDLFFDGSNIVPHVADMIETQWWLDVRATYTGEAVSLLAKWLPSDKTGSSNPVRDRLAMNVREVLGYQRQRDYRSALTSLRGRIKLLEQKMSRKEWDSIDYAHLPSQAHMRHTKAFNRNDGQRYQAYLESVNQGEATINAGTLYPYELYERVGQPGVDVLWDNLPDYTRPGQDALVMADVSGSMHGRPMAVSVSLALYFAERNTGPFNGYFMTFSTQPSLVKVQGETLSQRMRNIERSAWSMSTNLEAAFDAILRAGVTSGSVPKTLYIVSDMEFNQAVRNPRATLFDNARQSFAEVGLELPHVVFWNVNARNSQVPATILDGNVTLVSGLSPTVFSFAVDGKSPRELVDDIVGSERYERIVL